MMENFTIAELLSETTGKEVVRTVCVGVVKGGGVVIDYGMMNRNRAMELLSMGARAVEKQIMGAPDVTEISLAE